MKFYYLNHSNLNNFQENIQSLIGLERLIVSNNDLEYLDLSKFINLENLFLRNNNKIVKIELPIQNKFKRLSIYNNSELAEINLEVLNPECLDSLSLSSNNKLELKTEMFSKFINLESLSISDTNCSGSLFHFRNLNKLVFLWINNTNITPSFEYLNNNVSIRLYSDSPNNKKKINKFLTIEDNIILSRDINEDERSFGISEFKAKRPILIENAKVIIQLYNYLIEINKDKEQLDNYLLKEKENGIRFKAETEIEKAKFFYSNSNRFIMIYELFSKWIYDENKYFNEKSNASLAYYVELLIEKAKRENPNLTNEEIQEIQKIEYLTLI